ncbi:hypothetical protein PFICI_04906 [Pestalotiopsis fici W106-1]|uniref:C2H2-type domain-containing protein n=1 Tax=Pestalotiopsis fici (strain W106-1 / CGMCC3.15140) TaxID=1229662 RepID=W3XAE6_PESFW|nr:uncharacterized protein PFICI_04906 [Pestalotiopsis fici W106-1]ETS83030.1 hypothetical protein PFICI_04906 [Pestalotiopsis fici W106-1]
MESEKSPSGVRVRPATTDNSPIYNQDFLTPRRMTQDVRDSIDLRTSSRSSVSSEVRRSSSVSCVTRLASEDDCAKQRFIVWAAVKRNRSVRMAPSDRLRCPLLRCGEQFNDHETMLQHLHACKHLSAGEYLCYDCMKVEKFNDGKCKCCLSHKTKRRRIINAAKKVFSTLGHKSRRDVSVELTQVDFAIPPPPSYDSLSMEQEPQLPIESEISGNPVCEMEAVLPLELGSVNYEGHFNVPPPPPPPPQTQETNTFVPAASPFLIPPPRHDIRSLQDSDGRRPSLTLDTNNMGRPSKVPRTSYLSPSSSLRSANSSHGIISPISAGSASWTTNSSTIDTTLASPITPFSADIESSSLSRENSCKFPKDFPLPSFCSSWNTEPDRQTAMKNIDLCNTDNNFALGDLPELPGDDPIGMTLSKDWVHDPLLFTFGPKEDYSWPSTIDTEVNVVFTENNTDQENGAAPFNSDTRTLITDTWHALQQQLSYSLPNTRTVDNNLARRLENISAKDIILKGLASLKGILNGVDPTDPIDYLCFIHVVYAFTVVIHEEEAATHMNKLFKQALAYRNFVSASDRSAYAAIVAAIWEPSELEETKSVLGRSSSLKGKGPELRANLTLPFSLDPLIGVAQNFLDDLETSTLVGINNHQSIEVMTSELYSTHVAETGPGSEPTPDAFKITVNYVVQMLSQRFGPLSSSLIPKLRSISQKVANGFITSVRRMELELLQVGKTTLHSPELFDEYVPEVRRLCDPLYSQQSSNPRSRYHTLATALVESMVRNIESPTNLLPSLDPSTAIEENGLDYSFPEDPLADFLKDLDSSDFVDSLLESALDGTSNPIMESMAQTSESVKTSDKHSHCTQDDPPQSVQGKDVDVENTMVNRDATSAAEQEYLPQTSSHILPTVSISHGEDYLPPKQAAEAGPSEQKAEANDCCEICGYRPKGDPQWFKGSMAKHKKLQHSTEPPKIYRCTYPGCTSAYKNRPDNLRQHQIEKGHFVEGEGKGKQKKTTKRKNMDDD